MYYYKASLLVAKKGLATKFATKDAHNEDVNNIGNP